MFGIRNQHLPWVATVLTAGMATLSFSSSAVAQDRCDLNGVPGVPAPLQGEKSLLCGTTVAGVGPYYAITAVGDGLGVAGNEITIVGSNSFASDSLSYILPFPFEPYSALGTTVVGAFSGAAGDGNVAIGSAVLVGQFKFGVDDISTVGVVEGSTAVGNRSRVTNSSGTAIGSLSGAGEKAVALGTAANATSMGSVSIGASANATSLPGIYAIGIGSNVASSGNRSIAIGGSDGSGSTLATEDDAIAIGAGAIASHANSIALGAGSSTTAVDQVNVGGRTISDVAAGTAATDAVNVSQLTAATTGFATGLSAIEAMQTVLATDVNTLYDLRTPDRRDMKQGVAAAMSMAQAPMPSAPGKISYAVNGAMFRGEYAVGGSMQYRLNTRAPTSVNVGASFAGHKNNGFRAGIAGEF